MTKLFISTLVLATISFAFVACHEKAGAANWCPAPCDSVCPAPCDPTCQMQPSFGTYLTEKSVFESRLFENQLIGKKSKSRIYFYGWLQTGITVNQYGATHEYGRSAYPFNNRNNPDGTLKRGGYADHSGNSYVLQTEQPTNWKLNQIWFGARRDLTNRLDWGFQADFLYGTDPRYARNWGDQSFDYKWGSGDHFGTFSQLFATVGTQDLYLRVGKFAGSFSHEGLAAPREYFYTHSYLCFGRPLTAHGATVEWKPNKKWTFSGGWLAGVFTSFDNPYNDNGFLGKATYHFTKDVSLSYHIFYNDRGARPGPTGNRGFVECHNILILRWKLSPRWFYMSEIAYMDGNTYRQLDGVKVGSYSWGSNNHLIYTVNEKLSVGVRGEYHYSHRSTFDNPGITTTVPGNPAFGGQGGDFWAATLAAHYKINPKTTFRPEVRYDYADYNNGHRPFGGDSSKKDQLSGGVSFIVMF